jgi:hypothetical protein
VQPFRRLLALEARPDRGGRARSRVVTLSVNRPGLIIVKTSVSSPRDLAVTGKRM